jgi:hypothetical protein
MDEDIRNKLITKLDDFDLKKKDFAQIFILIMGIRWKHYQRNRLIENY